MTIIFNGRADDGATTASYTWQEAARADSITIVQCPDGLGRMFRLSCRETDAQVNGAYRAELSTHIAAPASEEWYYQEIYLPRAGLPPYLPDVLIGQWHSVDEGAEAYGRQPPIEFTAQRGDTFLLRCRYDATATSIQAPDSVTSVELAKYPLHQIFDRRVPVVVHAKWDWTAAGLLEIWIDHYRVVFREGPVSFNDAHGPYIKIGLSHIVTFGPNNPECYMLNSGCKIGDKDSSYFEMTGRNPYPNTVVTRSII